MKDTSVSRPHWVDSVDKEMTHTSKTSDWNQGFDDDLQMLTTGSNSKARRRKILRRRSSKRSEKDTPDKGKSYRAMLYRGHYSDTSSLASRLTTSSSDRRARKRSRTIALFIILLILALIVAALFGWLIYYLLSRPASSGDKILAADVSLRILNETYTASLANKTSKEFQRIESSLCREVDGFFLADNFSKVYSGCQVTEISDGTLLVSFRLLFNNTQGTEQVKWSVHHSIDAGATRHYVGTLTYVVIGDFLVDIRASWKHLYDGIDVELTVPVFNLNYSKSLADTRSSEFQSLADPFCYDVKTMLTTKSLSPFHDRFHGCTVIGFSSHPDRVTFKIQLTGTQWRDVQKTLPYVLMLAAKNATFHGQSVKMIGTLIVTPYNIHFVLKPANITADTTTAATTVATAETASTSTTSSTTRRTTTLPDLIYIYVVLPTYNLSLTPGLRDPQSKEFSQTAAEFCKDLERLYTRSIHVRRFYNCKIHSFRGEPTSVVLSVGYVGGEWPGMEGSVQWVIRRHAPSFYFGNKEVYLVGSIFLVLGEVAANGLELRSNLRVLNLTYVPDLGDQTTSAFQYHSHLFCRDMKQFYVTSIYNSRFFDCGVDYFTNNPVHIHFYLVFHGTSMQGLAESIVDVIRRFAQPVYYLMHLSYLVGDLLVLPEEIPVLPSVYPTNISVWPASTLATATSPASTGIISTTSSAITQDYGVMLVLYYEVYNLSYTEAYRNPKSKEFQDHKVAVCDDIWRWYMSVDSPFINVYRGCDLTSFNPSPTGVTFTLLFDTKLHEDFARQVRTFLEFKAPKVFVPKHNLLDVGQLLLIMDRYRIEVTTTLVPSKTLTTPTPTSNSVVLTSFSMTSTPVVATSSISSTTTSSSLGTTTSVLSYEFGLADFFFTTDLDTKTSARFKFLQQRFCADMDKYYSESSLKSVYLSCEIEAFAQRSQDHIPEKVYFKFTFNTPLFPEIRDAAVDVVFRNPPRVAKSGYMTLNVGDLFLIIDAYTSSIDFSTSLTDFSTRHISSTTDVILPTPSSTAEVKPTSSPTTSTTSTPPTTTESSTTTSTTTTPSTTTSTTQKKTTTTVPTTSTTTEPATATTTSTAPATTTSTASTTSTTASTTRPTTTTTTTAKTTTTSSTTTTTTQPTTTSSTTTTTATKPTTTSSTTTTTTTAKPTTTTSTSTSTTTTTTTTKPTTTTSTTTTSSPSQTTPTITTTTEATFSIRFSFVTLNLTHTDDLNNKSSETFKNIQEKFCADIEKIITDHKQHFETYKSCQIDVIGAETRRVNFSLQFREDESVDREKVKNLLVSMIHENAIRKVYNDILAVQLGNLLIWMNSISVELSTVPTSPSIYDAIYYNYTFYLYPGNFTKDLLDKNSPAFKETAYSFCKDVNTIFERTGMKAVKKRYFGCVVDEFGAGNEVKFRVALRDVDVVRPSSMFNIFAYHGERTNLDSIYHLHLGGVYVAVDGNPTYKLFKMDNFSTHPYPYVTTTPTILYTVITISLEVLKPDWSTDLSDPKSALHQQLTESFCSNVTRWLKEWQADYMKCGNLKFSQNPFTVTAELTFRGQQSPSLEENINTIISERANRVRLTNKMYALSIGDLLIFDKQLVMSQRTISREESTSGSREDSTSTPTSTLPTTTQEVDPCQVAVDSDYVRHPYLCDRFYQCIGGRPIAIPCKQGSVFDGSTCIPAPPGFVCNRQ